MSNEVGRPIQAGSTMLEFTGSGASKKRLNRAMKNPLDKCTIVSIYPKEIFEEKPTIEPGKFHIPAGSLDNPGLLVVNPSSWWKELDMEHIEIPVSSIQVSESIIKDYCNSTVGCNMADAMPGLFFVIGAKNLMEIKMQYSEQLKQTHEKQNNWFKVLVQAADSLWARSNGNPLAISDDMRIAAQQLNLNSKPWLKDYKGIELVKCKACGSLKDPAYPVCAVCKAIDTSNPMSADLKFAIAG